MLTLAASTGCGAPPVTALAFGLEEQALPAGTEVVSVAVLTTRELDFGCVGPSATIPRVGVVSSTAQLLCGIDPSCTPDAGSADVLSPLPVFSVDEVSSPNGVVIEDVPIEECLIFVEAFDADDRALGIGCATSVIAEDEETTVVITIESVL